MLQELELNRTLGDSERGYHAYWVLLQRPLSKARVTLQFCILGLLLILLTLRYEVWNVGKWASWWLRHKLSTSRNSCKFDVSDRADDDDLDFMTLKWTGIGPAQLITKVPPQYVVQHAAASQVLGLNWYRTEPRRSWGDWRCFESFEYQSLAVLWESRKANPKAWPEFWIWSKKMWSFDKFIRIELLSKGAPYQMHIERWALLEQDSEWTTRNDASCTSLQSTNNDWTSMLVVSNNASMYHDTSCKVCFSTTSFRSLAWRRGSLTNWPSGITSPIFNDLVIENHQFLTWPATENGQRRWGAEMTSCLRHGLDRQAICTHFIHHHSSASLD